MGNRFVKRDSDGKTIDLKQEEAERVDESARATRHMLVHPDGTQVDSSSGLPVDIDNVNIENAELEVDLDKENDAVMVWTNTAKDGSGTDYHPIVDSDGHLQVDVLSTSSGEANYAEDSAHTSGDQGEFILTVRNDTVGSLVDADGDYAPLQVDSSGRLWVNVDNTVSTSKDSSEHVHRQATGHELDSGSGGGDATESFTAPNGADDITVHVTQAEGSYHVEVAFQDGGGSDVTVRDNNDNADLGGDSTTDVYATVDVASPNVEVRVVDDSGASNTVNYNVYCR